MRVFLFFLAILMGFTSAEPLNGKENAYVLQAEQTVYITKTGAKYHRIGCRYLKSVIPIDKGEAVRIGYEPCKVCKP